MLAKVLGKESVSFIDEKTKEKVEGIKLHIAKDPPEKKIMSSQGKLVDTVWISRSKEQLFKLCSTLPCNSECDLRYDSDGKRAFLVDIKVIK